MVWEALDLSWGLPVAAGHCCSCWVSLLGLSWRRRSVTLADSGCDDRGRLARGSTHRPCKRVWPPPPLIVTESQAAHNPLAAAALAAALSAMMSCAFCTCRLSSATCLCTSSRRLSKSVSLALLAMNSLS